MAVAGIGIMELHINLWISEINTLHLPGVHQEHTGCAQGDGNGAVQTMEARDDNNNNEAKNGAYVFALRLIAKFSHKTASAYAGQQA